MTSNTREPISNEDGSVVVVFNGEIYNHAQLRQELKKRGHRFRSKCDTEDASVATDRDEFADRGLFVGHPEVKFPEGQITMKQLKIMPLTAEDAAEMRKPLRKRFREKFGV